MATENENQVMKLPFIATRGIVVMPGAFTQVDIGREISLAALDKAMHADQRLFLVAQKDPEEEIPQEAAMYNYGTITFVKQVIRMAGGNLRLLVTGESCAKIVKLTFANGFPEAEITPIEEQYSAEDVRILAHVRTLRSMFGEYVSTAGKNGDAAQAIAAEDDPALFVNKMVQFLDIDWKEQQEILEAFPLEDKMLILEDLLGREILLVQLQDDIQERVKGYLDDHQKEAFLREQLHAIHTELGDSEEMESDKLRERLTKSPIQGEAREKCEEELRRYDAMGMNSPEATISRTYIETMLDLPWGKYSKAEIKIDKARKILEEDHYGLKKVKERILEYLAVQAMNAETRTPIMCLVGPPGVGKTSIARSIARATGRKFVRMSLGGLRDEAEIRGHRRTYLGAIPGRIISQIKTCGTMNPLFLLDEIDKMASDFRGDPASAMLEVLDPEQNSTFSDHYLEVPFDLSHVMFLTTANSRDDIPAPLLDRMELIEVPGYTLEEKTQIAKRHLWPKQLKDHGFEKTQLKIADAAIATLIDSYTRESGVRQLERELASVCRKCAVQYLDTPVEERKPVTIRAQKIAEMLGAPKFLRMDTLKKPEIGIVNGLAWTPYGGETLQIEVAVMPGTGALELTGQLGDVMKESAKAAYSWLRKESEKLGIAEDFHKTRDVHVHVPEGATPKDGPSAGVAMTCAMCSALLGRPARQDIAMTGEITLLGRVLPIGGVKEKLLAAFRMGITTILLPAENEKDLEEIPENVREKMDIHLLKHVSEALSIVVLPQEGQEAQC